MQLLPYLASSPDLNLAENPIGVIKSRILNRRDRRPTSKRELMDAIEWEWPQFDQAELAHLVEGYHRRLKAVKRAQGGPTCHGNRYRIWSGDHARTFHVPPRSGGGVATVPCIYSLESLK